MSNEFRSRSAVTERGIRLGSQHCFPGNSSNSFRNNSAGPVVQSIVSLTSSLVVRMLTVLVSTISNSQVFLLKTCIFCICKSYSHLFRENISIYYIFNDQCFNDTLTNDIVSFEQLGPGSKHWYS